MSPSLHTFLIEIRERRLRRVLGIYVGIALPVIGIANMLESRYALSPVWFDRLLVLLVFGLLFAAVAGWYHGKEGSDRFQRRELILYGIAGLVAVSTVILLPARSRPAKRSRPDIARSIAVLPFKNLGGPDDYFSDGIMEDILTQLSKIQDLRVISRTTMMKYRETTKSIREIGDELKVAAVLEGSVRKSGDRVRIAGQLIDASTDEHLWAETYDRELKDIFGIQKEVAERIAEALRAALSPGETRRLALPPTESIEAYGLYLQGRNHYNRYTEPDNERAITLFQEALELDPDYAQALAGLGDAYSQRVQRYQWPVMWLDSAIAAGERAIALDPDLAEGHKALALAYDNLGEMDKAMASYERAIALNPNFASAIGNVGLIHYRTGRLDRALSMAVKLTTLAPDETKGHVQVAMALQALGEDARARDWYLLARSMNPKDPFPVLGLGWLELTAGNPLPARRMADTLLQLAPGLWLGYDLLCNVELVERDYGAAYEAFVKTGQPPTARSAYILQQLRRPDEASAHAGQALQRSVANLEAGDEREETRVEIAMAYAVERKIPESIQWLERASAAGLRDYRWTGRDPVFSSLHGNRAFDTLLAAMQHTVAGLRANAELP
jgi:TolB-like protein/Tfp pilus assembly protein PilF